MLASGTGAWRVRDTMNRVAAVLGVTIHVDLSLLSFECTCIEDGHCFNEVVSLPTTGVNTHRIWMMESFLKEIETYGRRFTVHEYHEMLKTVESSKPDYAPWQQGLAAACACGAFVFLLGGGPIEMACAFVGAGVGNFARSHILKQGPWSVQRADDRRCARLRFVSAGIARPWPGHTGGNVAPRRLYRRHALCDSRLSTHYGRPRHR